MGKTSVVLRMKQLGLFVLAISMVFSEKISKEARSTGDRSSNMLHYVSDYSGVVVMMDSLDFKTGLYEIVTIDLKINGLDDAVLLDSSSYQVKWKSSGADECMRVAPASSPIELSGSLKVSPDDQRLYPQHPDGIMYRILCKNLVSVATDSVYLFQ